MKKLTFALLGLITFLSLATGCSEDEEVTLTSHCFISSFKLGTMKRLVNSTNAAGNDTSFYISFTGGYYPMKIDQRAGTILLVDSLPMDTRLDAILASIKFEGLLLYQKWDKDAADTTWTTYNSSDSIDFTSPLRFRVYSTDGTSHKDYYLRLDCRSSEIGEYSWQKIDVLPCDSADERKLMGWGNSLFLLTEDEAGNTFWRYSLADANAA